MWSSINITVKFMINLQTNSIKLILDYTKSNIILVKIIKDL